MSTFIYSAKLGNAYVVGCGKCEIAKFWFKNGDDSHSPLSEEEAKRIAEKMVGFLNETIPVSSLSKDEYGDSDEYLMTVKLMNKFAELDSEEDEGEDEDGDDDSPSFEEFMKMMMLSSVLG